MFDLTYIHHDGFLLQTQDCGAVFDFWYDPTDKDSAIPKFLRDFPGDKPLYVFVSHFHKDHFNTKIFGWQAVHPDIRYILSRDAARHARHMIRKDSHYAGHKADPESVTIMQKGDIYSDELLNIQAFGSTDIGNSYAVTFIKSGLRVFHAGDLNCWAWRDESKPEEIQAAEKAFRSELRPIADAYPELDIAMFPVDSRIGSGYADGAREFVRKIKVARFFPMHFTLGDAPEEIDRRRRDAINFGSYAAAEGEYIALTAPYDHYSDEHNVASDAPSDCLQKEYMETYFLHAGDCNAEREISLPLLTNRLIEIATAHANHLEIGNPFMPNDHCGWVLSRLAIEMEEYPVVDSTYSITTWVESWNRHFSERVFCIADSAGRALGYARSIWMVLDTISHANAGLDALPFRNEFISDRPCPIKRQGKHQLILPQSALTEEAKASRAIIASEPAKEQSFHYSDLDAYRHVNTVRYVEMLMNQYSLREHDEYMVNRIELSFLHEGPYDKPLTLLRSDLTSTDKDAENGIRTSVFQLSESDTSSAIPILFSKISLRPRPSTPLPSL